MISGIGQGENENHDTMHRFALVAFFGAGFFCGFVCFADGFFVDAFLVAGFFFAVAMIYSPLLSCG